ncbi:hypothetical protein [Dactylosporangium sp. CA-092794]|uniref:hypothetical protein n=1 Tax=Dactylosporangium sp. CA-092794 TaxID=3239929 RepID=UPI003D8F5670
MHRDARPLGYLLIAELAGLLLLDSTWERTGARLASEAHNWYWLTFVRFGDVSGGYPVLWLALTVTATAAVAVPSLIRRPRQPLPKSRALRATTFRTYTPTSDISR